MSLNIKKWFNRIFSNVHHKYRLVLMSENFEEKFSLWLSRMNVFLIIGVTFFVLVAGTVVLVSFTKLKEFIPGYVNTTMTEQVYENKMHIDSLSSELEKQQFLFDCMRKAISGDVEMEEVENLKDSLHNYATLADIKSKEDASLRSFVENAEKYNIILPQTNEELKNVTKSGLQSGSAAMGGDAIFYLPLQGTIGNRFDQKEHHYGIDITGKKNDVVKSVLDGTVIMSEWTPDAGYVMLISHNNNILSVYKYNSALLKKTGDYVRAGEPIAFIGNEGENSNIPHLHFELWYNGVPVDPLDYIPF